MHPKIILAFNCMPLFNPMINIIISSVGDNPNLCGSGSCKKKNSSNVVIPIVASVAGLLILSLIVAAIFLGLRRRKPQGKNKDGNLNYTIDIDMNKEKILLRYEVIKLLMIFPVTMVDTESSINQNPSLESIQRQFTYSELLKITNNFERILGKGGFGTVYRGNIDDTQVAVKMLSPSSIQGFQQFQSEARNCNS
jgi:hypothetical protein